MGVWMGESGSGEWIRVVGVVAVVEWNSISGGNHIVYTSRDGWRVEVING